MTHDDYVPPPLMTITRKDNYAVADTINRIAKVRITAAGSVPIFAEVSVRTKAARLVISARVRSTHRHVESVCQSNEGRKPREISRRRGKRFRFTRGPLNRVDRIRGDFFLFRRNW